MKNSPRQKRRFFELSILMSLTFLILSGNLWALSNFWGELPLSSYFPAARDFPGSRPASTQSQSIRDSDPPVNETGAVKYGEYLRVWEPPWKTGEARIFVLDMLVFVVAGVLLFSALGLTVSVLGLGSVAADYAALRIDAAALVSGALLPEEKKKRTAVFSRRGVGLRIKLASFTICLVLLVVVMVSAPLYFRMIQTQQETLLEGLRDRASVLMESLASGARTYLAAEDTLELSFLLEETAFVPEARYATITGYNPATPGFDDQVWATNDPDILDKIDTAELELGVSRLSDRLTPRLENIAVKLNEHARSRVENLAAGLAALTAGAEENEVRASLETRLDEELSQIYREIGSEPVFPAGGPMDNVDRNYIFFKPILYRQGTDNYYFRGLVRLEVSIDSILDQIVLGKQVLLEVILFVALSALAIGVLGALILSGFIIRPIRRLVSHVELIRDTDDKSRLDGISIRINSNDELAVLGATINDMTRGLVKAAHASHDLIIGKEIQKKFIPLETDREGNKMTTGYKDTRYAQFFCYYEGAKGVSGDYFDYLALNGRYFAIIKCDVAGKGVPAALIMIQVATMFLNYFKTWKPDVKGMHIEDVVYQINDFIEALGFEGRFAAFTLALFDSFTGLLRFCNAGDNIIHWFDASERRMKSLSLPETPAAGVLPNVLVETKGGYTVQTFALESDDILFLYTDGIEEAKRKFRDSSFKEISCTEGITGTPHENHTAGQWDEEMGAARVEAVINAVMNRQVYTLRKHHNPEGDRDLKFDFTRCEGTVEETIMALVSVEKIFRIYKSPSIGEETRILVDKKVDEFLKKYFIQYQDYCHNTRECPENNMYMYYTHVNEDAQYDDLTILGIKRK
ncbi:MAG: SpoIIE family protein phosphatase [Treponema sp.]|jgi:serine phosphatase RsbU (regulator of sigma subunit)|nr:SpoIIE family protein phosphatase [Treponema sp.]